MARPPTPCRDRQRGRRRRRGVAGRNEGLLNVDRDTRYRAHRDRPTRQRDRRSSVRCRRRQHHDYNGRCPAHRFAGSDARRHSHASARLDTYSDAHAETRHAYAETRHTNAAPRDSDAQAAYAVTHACGAAVLIRRCWRPRREQQYVRCTEQSEPIGPATLPGGG